MESGIHAGYRLDQIDWNIAGDNTGQNPNIISELDWKDLEIWQVGGTGKIAIGNNNVDYRTYIRGSIDYGWITDGTVRDSDYNGDNRTQEYSRSISEAANDDVLDASLGLGFEKEYWQGRCTLGWLGGYSYHEQNLRFNNGALVIPHSIQISGLDSTYKSKWYGPFAGLDLELRPHPKVTLSGSVEYHWADFKAKANWNLRADLAHPVSYRQEANDGEGLVARIRGRYFLTNTWAVDLTFDYRDFSTKDGTHRNYLSDGTTLSTRLNEVNWKSYTTTVGFTYSFF